MSAEEHHSRRTTTKVTTETRQNYDIDSLMAQLNEMSKKLADAEAASHEWKTKHDSLKSSNDETIKDLHERCEYRDKEIESLKKRLAEAEQSTGASRRSAREAEQRMEDEAKAKVAAAEAKAKEKEKELRNMKKELRHLKLEKAAAEESLAPLKSELEEEQAKVRSRDLEIKELKEKRRTSTFGDIGSATSSTKVTELNVRIEKLTKEKDMLATQLAEKQTQLDEIKATANAKANMQTTGGYGKAKSEFFPRIKELQQQVALERSKASDYEMQIQELERSLTQIKTSQSTQSTELKRLQTDHDRAMEKLKRDHQRELEQRERDLQRQLETSKLELKRANEAHDRLEKQMITSETKVTSRTVIEKPALDKAEIENLRKQLQRDVEALRVKLEQSDSSSVALPEVHDHEHWRLKYEQVAAEKQALHRAHQKSLLHFDQQLKVLQDRLHEQLRDALRKQNELHAEDIKRMQRRLTTMSEAHANEIQKLLAQPRAGINSSSRSVTSSTSMSSSQLQGLVHNLSSDYSAATSKLGVAKDQLARAMMALQSSQQKGQQFRTATTSLLQATKGADTAVQHLLHQPYGVSGGGSSAFVTTTATSVSAYQEGEHEVEEY